VKRPSFTLDEKEYFLEKNIMAYEWRNSGGPAMAVLPFLLLNKRATKNIILGFLVRCLSIHSTKKERGDVKCLKEIDTVMKK
jgi:hypothetical protein